MSQFYQGVTSGALPPSVPTSFVTDSGTATPAANILNIITNDTLVNNDNGIQDVGSGNTVTISLTNRVTGTVTTTDATLTTLISFPLSVNTVYSMTGTVTARATATGDGASYDFSTAVRRAGGAAVEIGAEYPTEFEDITFATADIFVIVSGNNMVLQCQGVAGTTINWDGIFTYRQVS